MPLPKTEDSFTLADYWYLEKPDVFRLHNIETLSADPDDPEFTYLYSIDDLSKLHHLLPHVMHGLLDLAKKSDESYINGDYVRQNLNYLRNGAVSFMDTGGIERNFARIIEMQLIEAAEPRVHLRGINIYVHLAVVNGQEVPLVENYSLMATQVTQAELNKNYPGWLDRWHFAVDLGLDKEALCRYLFRVADINHHSLPDVTFD